MSEKLLHDYWLESGRSIYPDFEISIQAVAGGVVIFREEEPGIHGDFEQITVDLLDVMGWIYTKVNT